MTEFMEPEEEDGFFKPNGHEPGRKAGHKTGPKVDHARHDYSPVAQHIEPPMETEEETPSQEDLNLITEVLEEFSSAHRSKQQPSRFAEQAAALVARYGNQASSDSIYMESAMRLTGELDPGPPRADTPRDGWFDGQVESSPFLEDVALIKALFKAASRAGSEKEAGLQAALSVPLMIQRYRRADRNLWSAIPALSAGMNVLARFLYRSEASRPLVMELPKVLRAALDRLAWYASHRRAITSNVASTVLAEQTGIWLASRTRRSPEDRQTGSKRSSVDSTGDQEE
jgi:hypothetical protein